MRADLSDQIAVDGPFVSVYLASPSTDPQAADQLELRWKNARRALEDEGADDRPSLLSTSSWSANEAASHARSPGPQVR
ncbi:MAG: hypothetical protein M3507_05880 [Actinomycetota bacterium]|jgi:hypothetical protein|nr:hypothetical protein [Actinomycetota bacterium]